MKYIVYVLLFLTTFIKAQTQPLNTDLTVVATPNWKKDSITNPNLDTIDNQSLADSFKKLSIWSNNSSERLTITPGKEFYTTNLIKYDNALGTISPKLTDDMYYQCVVFINRNPWIPSLKLTGDIMLDIRLKNYKDDHMQIKPNGEYIINGQVKGVVPKEFFYFMKKMVEEILGGYVRRD